MFRKKPAAPSPTTPWELPAPPTAEQIEADLAAAAHDDPVFLTQVPDQGDAGTELVARFSDKQRRQQKPTDENKGGGNSDDDQDDDDDEDETAKEAKDKQEVEQESDLLYDKAIEHHLNTERVKTLQSELKVDLEALAKQKASLDKEVDDLKTAYDQAKTKCDDVKAAKLVTSRNN